MHTCTTQLKQRLFTHFPDMQAQSKGRVVMLVFDKDIGAALDKVCDQDSNSEAVHLASAAQIVCQHMFDSHALHWIILSGKVCIMHVCCFR